MKGYGDATVLALYRDHGVVPKDSRDDNHNRTGKDTNDYKYVRKGDLVINKMKAWQGSLSVSGYEGIVSPAYFIYEFVGQRLSRDYADYLLRSTYKQEFERVSGGIREGQWDLPRYDFEHMQLPLPSIEEQERIADYLDKRCAAIDEVRKTITDEIEALRRLRKATIHRAVTKGLDEGVLMRDSGVVWIGEIPDTWEMKRIKYLVSSRVAGAWGDLPELGDKQVTCLRIADFDYAHLRFKNPLTTTFTVRGYTDSVVSKCRLRNGDILVEKSGGGEKTPVGRAVLFDLDGEYVYANFMDRLRVQRGFITPSFFLYVWSDMYANQMTRLYFNQTTGIQNLVFDRILSSESFPLPSLSEQQRIADYLDERCADIDSVIDIRTRQLERLEDYRRALIFAYVTGKKEVPSHE